MQKPRRPLTPSQTALKLHPVYIMKPLFIQNLPIASVTKHICITVATQLRTYINHILVLLQCLRFRSTTRQFPNIAQFTNSLRMRVSTKHRILPDVVSNFRCCCCCCSCKLQPDADRDWYKTTRRTSSHNTVIMCHCLSKVAFVILLCPSVSKILKWKVAMKNHFWSKTVKVAVVTRQYHHSHYSVA